jgi:SAM-dependent methyltransferase
MRNPHGWRPTRFVPAGRGWRGSSDASRVGPGSRHTADLEAAVYANAMREHARGRLLDLGCGNVPLYEMYRPRITSAVCVDWPNSYHGRAHVDVACDLNRPLPFADDSFDTIVMSDVLEHLFDYQTVWSEMARVLRPSGRLILGVPFLYWLHEEPFDYFRPTEFALRRYCDQHRLRVVALEPFGGALDVLFDITAKHLAVSTTAARGFYWAGRAVMPLGRRLFARTDRKFPLGYLLVAER